MRTVSLRRLFCAAFIAASASSLYAESPSPDFVTQKTRILQLTDKQYYVSLCHLILGDTKGILTMFVRKVTIQRKGMAGDQASNKA